MTIDGIDINDLKLGDVLYIDPRRLPEIVIISKEDAEKIANESPKRQFIITEIK